MFEIIRISVGDSIQSLRGAVFRFVIELKIDLIVSYVPAQEMLDNSKTLTATAKVSEKLRNAYGCLQIALEQAVELGEGQLSCWLLLLRTFYHYSL